MTCMCGRPIIGSHSYRQVANEARILYVATGRTGGDGTHPVPPEDPSPGPPMYWQTAGYDGRVPLPPSSFRPRRPAHRTKSVTPTMTAATINTITNSATTWYPSILISSPQYLFSAGDCTTGLADR